MLPAVVDTVVPFKEGQLRGYAPAEKEVAVELVDVEAVEDSLVLEVAFGDDELVEAAGKEPVVA